ncbi:hypothetical protein [Vibrio sp. D431a]|uniref:hypothetical protein n=1 Tax=Vibrio sp. D431a TaxID=2837388 RepID=UPI00255768DB|nr:hypothetical protein [Vibrio sp. D431a]MDK9789803.1 hypothetical protein [Vibrio sp. D431a]
MKKNVALMVAGATLVAGCSDNDGTPETKVVYVEKSPSQEEIQAAVKAELARMNREGEELRDLVRTLKQGDPSVQDAYYSYENGEKVLKIVSQNPTNESSFSEYVVPVGVGILAGYTGARLADAILDSNRRYRQHCHRDMFGNLVGEGCYRGNPYHYGVGAYYQPRFPVVIYDDYDDYSTSKRRYERAYYNERVRRAPSEKYSKFDHKPKDTKVDHSKKTASERAAAIHEKQKELQTQALKDGKTPNPKKEPFNSGLGKQRDSGKTAQHPFDKINDTGNKANYSNYTKPVVKVKAKPKPKPAKKMPKPKRKAFSNSNRRSTSKWGSSSRSRSSGSSWGGSRSRGFGG